VGGSFFAAGERGGLGGLLPEAHAKAAGERGSMCLRVEPVVGVVAAEAEAWAVESTLAAAATAAAD
jgi:hypothetical protein